MPVTYVFFLKENHSQGIELLNPFVYFCWAIWFLSLYTPGARSKIRRCTSQQRVFVFFVYHIKVVLRLNPTWPNDELPFSVKIHWWDSNIQTTMKNNTEILNKSQDLKNLRHDVGGKEPFFLHPSPISVCYPLQQSPDIPDTASIGKSKEGGGWKSCFLCAYNNAMRYRVCAATASFLLEQEERLETPKEEITLLPIEGNPRIGIYSLKASPSDWKEKKNDQYRYVEALYIIYSPILK